MVAVENYVLVSLTVETKTRKVNKKSTKWVKEGQTGAETTQISFVCRYRISYSFRYVAKFAHSADDFTVEAGPPNPRRRK
jgi:hypothetical protein